MFRVVVPSPKVTLAAPEVVEQELATLA